jgi:hypothetical protein
MPRRRRTSELERRDRERRSSAERALLDEVEARRRAFSDALEASNILHGKHLCPCCGLPTIDERGDYEVCVVCLWEDGIGETDPRRVSPPNYVSLERARIDVGAHLRAYEAVYGDLLRGGVDPLVRAIKRFGARLQGGEVELDRGDFVANLAQIVAS